MPPGFAAGEPARPRHPPVIVVAARNEGERIGAALDALAAAFRGAAVWVADDASGDGTVDAARARGARVVTRPRPRGKGANVSAAAEAALREGLGDGTVVLLCDADLGASAARLRPLVEAVLEDRCDLAIAAFSRRVGGGFGLALGFSRWAVQRLTGTRLEAPISGQRAMPAAVLRTLLPFGARFGLETAMDIDALRAGYRVCEVEIDLEHRATGRTPAGFLHRARQLRDFLAVYLSRRRQ